MKFLVAYGRGSCIHGFSGAIIVKAHSRKFAVLSAQKTVNERERERRYPGSYKPITPYTYEACEILGTLSECELLKRLTSEALAELFQELSGL